MIPGGMSPPMQGGWAAAPAVAVDYNRDWPFAAEARADFGPWATISDGVNGTTGTFWNNSGQLVAAAQYSRRITYDPVTLECRGLVVEAVPATDLSTSAALNVAAVTQTVTVSAGSHIVSFTGTGTVTLSGAATGTISGTGADRPAALRVTTTAGALTLTVSGQVRNLDCVSGTQHGQPIAGGTARATESYRITGAGFTNFWPGAVGYIYYEWWDKSLNPAAGTELYSINLNDGFSQSLVVYYNTNTQQMNLWVYYSGALQVIATTTTTYNLRAKNKVVVSWGPAGIVFVLNGGTPYTRAMTAGWPAPNMLRIGNTLVSGSSCMVDVARMTSGTNQLSVAQAQAITTL